MAATDFPAATLPVNVTAAMFGSSMSGFKSLDDSSAVRKRLMGKPASLKISSRANAHPGTLDACFKTPPFPAIRCGAANRMTCQKGKFHGMTARMTPRGLKVANALGGAPGPEWPALISIGFGFRNPSDASAKYSQHA